MAMAETGADRSEFMRELKSRLDLVEVVAQTVALRPAGREFVGLCPFHEERTPSFHVSREKQVYHCHGCHAGGDAVTFVMRTLGLDFPEALAELAGRVGLQPPARGSVSEAERRRLGAREELYAACAAAAAYFRAALVSAAGRDAIAYLRQRGVDGPTADRFALGYAPADWEGIGRALGDRFAPERLIEAGLRRPREGKPGTYDYFRGRLMFPIWDERARVIAFGGRALDPAERAKYLNSPATPLFHKSRTLYALHLARPAMERKKRAVVVEGYMDALTCHQFGFDEVVASMGTALSDEQAGMLARSAEVIILAYDADPAGNEATERALALLQERGKQVAVATLLGGKDPDEALRLPQGAGPFATALAAAVPLIHYLVRRAIGEVNVATLAPEQRWRLAERLLPYLARVPAELGKGTRQAYIEWVARAFGLIEPHDLKLAVDALAEKGGGHRNSKTWNASRMRGSADRLGVGSGAEAAEETLLAACLRSSAVLRRLSPELSIHDFRRAPHKALATRLLQEPASGEGGDAALGGGWGADSPHAAATAAAETPEMPGLRLLEVEEDPEQRDLIGHLLALDLPTATPASLRQCLGTLRRARLQEEAGALRAEQRRLVADGRGDSPEMVALTRRLIELTAELARSAQGGGDGPATPGRAAP